ncbi:MAG: aminotransferase class I/II-fold pyridoxal phosphate-dependent enzyme [Pseudomonadota bacterium]
MTTFSKSFTQQEPIPEDAIEAAVAVMRSGRLHRYNVLPDETAEAEKLEAEFAAYMGASYCLAVTSGGYAIQIALRAAGLKPGDPVLSNAFTLAPVPGAVEAVGAKSVLVETASDYCIDLDDLEAKAAASGARTLLLSHMRGHIVDMDRVMEICGRYDLTLIEDCAHTMGADWDGRKSGSFGKAACFSTQTYKHVNSGEGGFLTTNDPELAARATIYSGSYMLYGRHGAGPGPEVFDKLRLEVPNMSGRMDNLRAAMLRPQLARLDDQCRRWNALYHVLEEGLRNHPQIRLPERPAKEGYVASSIQFSLPAFSPEQFQRLLALCLERGVELKWFGNPDPNGYTSRFDSWRYMEVPELPRTLEVLSTMCDMRIPLTFDEEDCRVIAEVVAAAAREVGEDHRANG